MALVDSWVVAVGLLGLGDWLSYSRCSDMPGLVLLPRYSQVGVFLINFREIVPHPPGRHHCRRMCIYWWDPVVLLMSLTSWRLISDLSVFIYLEATHWNTNLRALFSIIKLMLQNVSTSRSLLWNTNTIDGLDRRARIFGVHSVRAYRCWRAE